MALEGKQDSHAHRLKDGREVGGQEDNDDFRVVVLDAMAWAVVPQESHLFASRLLDKEDEDLVKPPLADSRIEPDTLLGVVGARWLANVAENHGVFRRVDNGQRYFKRPGGVAAGENSASVLGLHGLRSPRGLLVDSCRALCPRGVRAPREAAPREAAVEKPRLVHVEDQLDIEPL